MTGRLLHDLLRHFKPLAPPGAGEWTDRQLVERFASQRDEDAFASLVRRHGPLVLGVGRRILHQDQDAEDVFQATFLVLARHAASRRWQTSIAGWLYCVAYRLAVRAGQQSGRRREVERAAGGRIAAAAVIEDRSALYRVLDEELQRLSDELREPLVLCYLEGKTRDQAACRLGWSVRTLQRRLSHGLQLLRRRLGKRGIELPLALLTAGLSQQAASAALSPAVVATTVEATMQCGPGAAPVGGVISSRVSALVEEGSRTMTMTTMTKTIIGAVVLLVLSAAAAVVAVARDRQPAVKQPAEQPVAEQSKASAPVESTWPEGATVKGRVVDHRGNAVANAEVLLLGAERIGVEADRTWFVMSSDKGLPKPPSVRTDAKGEFSIARKKGTANRIAVIAAEVLFWSVPRRSLAAAGRVEVKLPAPGKMALRCALPGKDAKQPVAVTLQGAEPESDFLRFHSSSYTAKNPGETVFEHLPPGEYAVERVLHTPTGTDSVLMTMADRQRVKVEASRQATVRFERKVGRPITGRVRGLENIALRYAHVTIMYTAAPERFPDGKTGRQYTAFDVLPIKSDGRFTTDPIPPGKYHLHLFAVRDSSIEHSNQQSDFDGFLQFTVPQLGEMPKLEVIAKPATSPPISDKDYRARVVDEAGKPLPRFQAMLDTASNGYIRWREGRNGLIGLGHVGDPRFGLDGEVIDLLVRADGHAPGLARFAGKDREKLRQGKATIALKRGEKVELRFRLPDGLTWPKNTMPEAYFTDFEERVRPMRQPTNRRRGEVDFNMLNLRPAGAGRFECRLAEDTPPFHVAIHVPGFLQCFEAGPFTLASFKQGVLEIDVPRPATLDIRFDPGTARADALPFKGVALVVYRQIQGNSYLDVATVFAAGHKHALELTDLAPGSYLVSVRTQPKAEGKQVPGAEINPGAYYDRRKPVLAAGASERIHFGWTAFDPNAFRGKRTALVRIRMPDGTPAKGRKVSVSWYDGHYGSLPVFAGQVPASGELRLEGLTDRLRTSGGYKRPYTVTADGRQLGRFGFTKDQPAPEFEFHLRPQAGDMAPDVELTRVSTGKAVRLSSLRGKIVCLEFWASWCGPCQPAMAKLNGLAAEQRSAWKVRVAIVVVSIDDGLDRARSHAQRRGWNQVDHHWTGGKTGTGWDAPAARAFGVNGVPEAVLIGSDGRILWRGHPMATEGGRSLEARINEALKK
jgi:RNA polymerase sigma factor (sigma-70 family)